MQAFRAHGASADLYRLCLTMCAATALLARPAAAQSTTVGAEPRPVVPSRVQRRTALPMTLDQPLVCGPGRVRAEQPVAHERVVPALTLTTARFDLAPLPPGAVVSGRVTWRIRPTSAPNHSVGRFNIAAAPPPNSGVPGLATLVQVHDIGSVPVQQQPHTVLRPGPWDAVAVPNAVLVAADLQPALITAFNTMRSTLLAAGVSAPVVLQSQVGSLAQTTYAILETCHVPGPAPAAASVRTP